MWFFPPTILPYLCSICVEGNFPIPDAPPTPVECNSYILPYFVAHKSIWINTVCVSRCGLDLSASPYNSEDARLTAQCFQCVRYLLNFAYMNVADISHKIGNLVVVSTLCQIPLGVVSYISLVISGLLVNVVVAENLVDWPKLAYSGGVARTRPLTLSQDTRHVVMDINDLKLLAIGWLPWKVDLLWHGWARRASRNAGWPQVDSQLQEWYRSWCIVPRPRQLEDF